jgi:hypothetical protein
VVARPGQHGGADRARQRRRVLAHRARLRCPWRWPGGGAGPAVRDPAKVVFDLAVMLAVGRDCLADVAVLRAEPGVYGPVPPPTSSTPCVSFGAFRIRAAADCRDGSKPAVQRDASSVPANGSSAAFRNVPRVPPEAVDHPG